jgi:6-phosphofructokinase 2
MIYTVTLNPALDRAVRVDRLMEEDTIRIVEEEYYAAGKGIDVSRVIRELGGESVALGLVGGYDGLHLEGLLINAGVMTDFTKISQETRTNIILNERCSGRQFVIAAAGPEVSAAEIGQFYQHILGIIDMDYLVMSGSLPRGVSPNLYGQLILAGKKKGIFIFLDADGKALKESSPISMSCAGW